MRWFIGLLLLLNLVFFLWTRMDPRNAPEREAPPPEVGELRLWSEVEQERRADVADPLTETLPVVASDEPSTILSDAAEPESDLGGGMPKAAEGFADPAPVTAAVVPELVLPQPHTLSVAVEPEDVPVGPEGLPAESPPESAVREGQLADSKLQQEPPVLASEAANAAAQPEVELPAQSEERLAQTPPNSTEPETDVEGMPKESPETEPRQSCGEVRWFADQAAASAFADSLSVQGVVAEVRAEQRQEQTGYWVLVPPQPTGDAARAVRTQLRDKGIEDLWLFTAGPLRNSISLGMFRGQGRADRRADEIRALGFDVEVRPKLSDKTEYLVDYRVAPNSVGLIEAALVEQTDLESRAVVCP